MSEFVETTKPLLGPGRPIETAILRDAGENRVPTVGLHKALNDLWRTSQVVDNHRKDLANDYQVVREVRKTVNGARLYRALDGHASFDVGLNADLPEEDLDPADDAMLEGVQAMKRQGESGVSVLSQLIQNAGDRAVDAAPRFAEDTTTESLEALLAESREWQSQIEYWLDHATIDEMADAVWKASKVDEAEVGLLYNGRDERSEEERWRAIGRKAPFVGTKPERFIAAIELLTCIRPDTFTTTEIET